MESETIADVWGEKGRAWRHLYLTGHVLVIVALVVIHIATLGLFVPIWVAMHRRVPNAGSVAVIDIFLGWTLVGWVVALAMACRSMPPKAAAS